MADPADYLLVCVAGVSGVCEGPQAVAQVTYLERQGAAHARALLEGLEGEAREAQRVKLLDGMKARNAPPDYKKGMRSVLE